VLAEPERAAEMGARGRAAVSVGTTIAQQTFDLVRQYVDVDGKR